MNQYRFLKILSLILSIFYAQNLTAQKPDLQFEKLTDKSGRTLGFVTGVVQDNDGFLWISTRKGLFKYDGYTYTLFRNKPKDSTSLPFNDITRIYLDKQNNLWLRHFDQFAVLSKNQFNRDFKAITKKRYSLDSRIIEDKNGQIWISSNEDGVFRSDPKKQKIENFKQQVSQYTPSLYHKIDSLTKKANSIAEIIDVKNNSDLQKGFTLQRKMDLLVVSVGESNLKENFDYGSISNTTSSVWKQQPKLSMNAGGGERNRMQVALISLPAGKYSLAYQSDDTNAYNSWKTGDAPNKVHFYGIKLIEISEADRKSISNLLQKKNTSSSTISSNDVKDLLTDPNGNTIAITSEGIDLYSIKDNKFENIAIDYARIFNLGENAEFSLNCSYLSKSGLLWLGTSEGLLKFNLKNQAYQLYKNNSEADSLITGNNITCIMEDSHGTLWIGTDKGLNLYFPKKNIFYRYMADNKNRMYDNQIYAIYEDNGQNIWIGSTSGLNKLRKSRFTYTDLKTDIFSNYPILVQNKDHFWYHGENNLLMCYDRSNNAYTPYPIKSEIFPIDKNTNERWYFFNHILSDQYQQIWIAINNGIYRFDRNSSQIADYAKVPSISIEKQKLDDNIRQALVDGNNHLWLFSQTGIYDFDIAKNRTTLAANFGRTIKQAYDIDNFIKNVCKDRNDNFWIRTASGIYFFGTKDKKLELKTAFDPDLAGTSVVDGNIYEDKLGTIWYAVMPKLYQFDPNTKQTKTYNISNNSEVGNCYTTADAENNIWIYTDNGLYRHERKSKEVRMFTNDDGLADNNINGFFDDQHRNIWVTSAKGISRYDKKSETFENLSGDFYNSNFTCISETNLNQFGEVLFFTNRGFYSFSPDSTNKNRPKLAITRLLISDKEVHFEQGQTELRLEYKNNSITFEFAALDFTDPASNQYAYMLEGFNTEWQNCDASNRKAVYTNLDPKTYTFKLKGSNNDGLWNENGISLSIVIKPPFYRTILFYVICAITAFWIVILIIKWRERTLQKEKRILEQKVEERTVEIEKSKEELKQQRDIATMHRDQIAAQNKNITDSIHYASRIQSAILPPLELIERILPEFFVLYKPRDIVSGDFYWLLEKDSKIIIAAADCTGHGVPGAFMSMLGIAFLNEIVTKKEIYHPNEILNELKNNVIKSLHQTGRENEAKDGMDIALCTIDMERMMLEFAGAYNPLLLIRKGELIQIKADHMPIGIHSFDTSSFTNNEYPIEKGDSIYLFSDGYVDQFGGPDQRKFMIKNFKNYLLSIQDKNMAEQKELLDQNIENWKGETDQIDDILVVGIKIG